MIKIIAVLLALAMMMFFAVPASAVDTATATEFQEQIVRGVEEEYLNILRDYEQGRITYEQYVLYSNELDARLREVTGDNSTVGDYVSNGAESIGNTIKGITGGISTAVEKFGTSANKYISDFIGDFFDDYTQMADIESPDNPSLNGYSAMIVLWRDREKGLYTCYYSNNGGIVYDETYQLITYDYYEDYQYFNKIFEDTASGNSHNFAKLGLTGVQDYEIYGNWSTSDGSEAETNDKYTQEEILNFTNTSDSELDMLLQAILEQLKRQNPDLSSLEGLLESIYYRLGQLDSDNDNGLLAQINAAIIALAQDGNAQNTAMISKLDELKDILEENKGDTDLSPVIEELKSISSTLKGIAAIEVAENLLELSESEQKLFNEYADLIPVLVDKIGLALVTKTMVDIESVIFTASAPNDLTFTIFGTEYVLLSTETFSNDEIMDTIGTIKTFISVILIYVWCLRMRKLLI